MKVRLRSWLYLVLAFGLGFGLAWSIQSFRQPVSSQKQASQSNWFKMQPIVYPSKSTNRLNKCPAEAEFNELRSAASPEAEAVQALAHRWTANVPAGPLHLAQLLTLADSLLTHWTYEAEPTGRDRIQPAVESIYKGLRGDCEDFAVTGAALVQALGGRVRVVKAWRGENGHSWLEIGLGVGAWDAAALGQFPIEIEGNEYWLRVDWTCHSGACFEADRGLVFDLAEKSCFALARRLAKD